MTSRSKETHSDTHSRIVTKFRPPTIAFTSNSSLQLNTTQKRASACSAQPLQIRHAYSFRPSAGEPLQGPSLSPSCQFLPGPQEPRRRAGAAPHSTCLGSGGCGYRNMHAPSRGLQSNRTLSLQYLHRRKRKASSHPSCHSNVLSRLPRATHMRFPSSALEVRLLTCHAGT